MTCGYERRGHCNPLVRGGCPCSEVQAHRGPMTLEEIAEALNLSWGTIASCIQTIRQKVRAFSPFKKRLWLEVLDGWPTMNGYREPETLTRGDCQEMNAQIDKKFREFGWKLDEGWTAEDMYSISNWTPRRSKRAKA